MSKYTPSKLYWHEALDRASLVRAFFNENVEQHPAVANDPELKYKAAQITEFMADFYQVVGKKHYKFDKLQENKP